MSHSDSEDMLAGVSSESEEEGDSAGLIDSEEERDTAVMSDKERDNAVMSDEERDNAVMSEEERDSPATQMLILKELEKTNEAICGLSSRLNDIEERLGRVEKNQIEFSTPSSSPSAVKKREIPSRIRVSIQLH